ncbi:MAG: hypothetical protein EBT60_08750 [Bacteroidetes bacterium]|nr:hypothetical protein [Bacteroidota bacterium]
MMRYLLFTLGFLASSLNAQKGCTDPQASNYDPTARYNDGSCLYPNTLISPKILVQKLSDSLNETSGLAKFGEQWFSHNDGGNPALLYQLNKNGKINKSHPITNPTPLITPTPTGKILHFQIPLALSAILATMQETEKTCAYSVSKQAHSHQPTSKTPSKPM